jgi:hypothetical protein
MTSQHDWQRVELPNEAALHEVLEHFDAAYGRVTFQRGDKFPVSIYGDRNTLYFSPVAAELHKSAIALLNGVPSAPPPANAALLYGDQWRTT